jgi:hypothetical protein
MRRLSVSLALIGVLALALNAGAQAPSPFVGTWKLDVAKSKFPGAAPKSVTVMIERTGDTTKVAVDAVDAADVHANWGYTSVLGGKEAPVVGNPAYDTVSGTETSPRETSISYKKAGKVVSTLKSVVSADGKTLTITSSAADAMGKPTTSTQVYAKQ